MVLHTNGETFKMSKIYYPKLGTSKYFRKILRIEEYTLQHVDRINFVSKSSKVMWDQFQIEKGNILLLMH